jgi:2-polyprenyl-3-methyl-5-hydroxy-6-metoxy-1,4-benzoquinol methylase
VGAVHPWADEGFGRAAHDYERGRPSYPAEALAFLVDRLRLAAGRTVVDLAAGTGKLSRLLVRSGAHVARSSRSLRCER